MNQWIVVGIILVVLGPVVSSNAQDLLQENPCSGYGNYAGDRDSVGYGYRLYEPGSPYDSGPVHFNLDEPETLFPLAHSNHSITGGCYNSHTYTWYVCDEAGDIWSVDLWSGDMTRVFGNGEGFSALSFDPQADSTYGAYEYFLYGLDLQSGEILWTWDVAGSSTGPILGLAARGGGYLYFVDSFDNLYRFDLYTFNTTLIGPLLLDIEGSADLEFDINTGILYLSAHTTQGGLYTVDTKLGKATLIGAFEEGASVSGFCIPWNWPSHPPDPPRITGPKNGKINIAYEYTFVSTNPEAEDLTYIINWSDGTVEEHGIYPSGEPITVNHTWSEKGTFIIKAKARTGHGVESEWGLFEVTMPLSYGPPLFRFFAWLFERFPNAFPLLRHLAGY